MAGDQDQLYTIEYWEKDSEAKRAGMQIYVSDAKGKRCLTNETDVVGYLNLTDSSVFYVNSRGINMIERKHETVKEVVSISDASYLLLAQKTLYYFASGSLFAYDLDSEQQVKIASGVLEGYLDYSEEQLYYCTNIDPETMQSTLCTLKKGGDIETVYSFNALHLVPYKMIDAGTLLCAMHTQEGQTDTPQYSLVLLSLRDNTQHVLLPNFVLSSYAQNGDQVIAGTGTNAVDVYWLIELKNGSAKKLPAWGTGALNFTANRLFAVNVVDVKVKELFRKNDQFYDSLLD